MDETKRPIPYDKIAEFCRRNQIRELSVFGSFVREDFGPESDIDLLVEFEPTAKIGLLGLSRLQRELEQILERPVDLVPRSSLKATIREPVLRSAEVLYAA